MKMEQLNGLLALKAVAETQNFRQAAMNLGVSASAVSQAVKQLEDRLGVALLARTTRSTSLTPAGERFLSQAGPAIDQILDALEDIGSSSKKPSGLLRINLPRHIYTLYLLPVFSSFMLKYPEITLDLTFEDKQSEDFGKGYDARVLLSDFLAKDLVALKLFGPVRFVTAASPAYLKKHGRPAHPRDLLSHNCIRAYCEGESIYDRWEFEHAGKEFEVHVRGNLILNDTLTMVDAAVAGVGVIYAFDGAIADQVRSGELEVILKQYAATSTGFFLYYPNPSKMLPKLRVFIDHIKSERKLIVAN